MSDLTRKIRSLHRGQFVLFLCLLLIAVALGGVAWAFNNRLDAARDDRAVLRAAFNEANARLVEVGEKPVEPPVAGEPGAAGEPGQRGRPPTAAEIRDAVDAYCNEHPCRGPSGKSVTPGQVAGAVAAYCNDRGQCRGPRGGDGSDGAAGAQGPPPSDAQVAAAVAAFCADGRCRGPVGPPGPPGTTGTAGTGIASVVLRQANQPTECDLIVTFTDGTAQNAGQVTCPVAP